MRKKLGDCTHDGLAGNSPHNGSYSVSPTPLYYVDEQGIHHVSGELKAIGQRGPVEIAQPRAEIESLATKSDAEKQVTQLAIAIARRPQAGLMAAISDKEGYLDPKAQDADQERARLKAECLALPDYIKVRDVEARKSMTHLEWWGHLFALVCLALMALWTATSDVTIVHGNLTIAFPVESDEIDFSALYGAEAGFEGDAPSETQDLPTTSLFRDPNFYKSIAVFSTLFVLAAMLDVLKVMPLCSLQPMPRGLQRKFRWLFSSQGLIALVQCGLLASAVAFNLRIGFELDLTASDVDPKPPVTSALAYSLMAIALAFSTYAFVHWTIQTFENLCGVRSVLNPARLAIEKRLEACTRILDSIRNVLAYFKRIQGDQEAFENLFVAKCLSVLAGIQEEQRRAADFADAAAKQAAATARMQALKPSDN